jgi:hypothetical protein
VGIIRNGGDPAADRNAPTIRALAERYTAERFDEAAGRERAREAMEGIDATYLVYPDITGVSGCL